MKIGCLEIKLGAPWVHSLKEKRMIVRSLVAKIRNTFNVSVHEIDDHDVHQQIVLGITTGSNSTAQLQSVLDQVVNFIESNYEVSIDKIQIDIL
ncbi:Protein of uncharacterised function (DUF503) [Turicibacter sanguinis]|nr:Protein of uncharacterised function (DUF503) [Turicibacter sanguinis]